MMIKNKSSSMKDLQVQGRNLLGSANGIDDISPKKKKTKRLPGRSKSLVDTGSNSKPFCSGDVNRNIGRYTHSYLRRAPTQDDIYKILNETSEIIRPSTSTGESKRLSPYVPLPAIGDTLRPLKNRVSEVSNIPDATLVASGEDSVHKLVREGTYNVLEPKFVRGPNSDRNTEDKKFKERKNKREMSREPENKLQESSATIIFGPRLPKGEAYITEDDLMATDFPGQQQGHSATIIPNVQGRKSVPVNQGSNVTMEKLYYRITETASQQNGSQRLANDLMNVNVHGGADDKPKVHQSLWFDC